MPSDGLTEEQVKEWLRLANSATAGPWSVGEAASGHLTAAALVAPSGSSTIIKFGKAYADAAFIAAARTALPVLCRALLEARTEQKE